MKTEVKNNLNIKPSELIYKVHANKLTTISKMYDFKGDPLRHAKYVVYTLKIDYLIHAINDEKQKFNGEDNVYKKINEMQNQLNELRQLQSQVL